jgi:cellulose synthase/poly-beta-1,6-N-acetylglucosamine synthase-like glycosyltransferase
MTMIGTFLAAATTYLAFWAMYLLAMPVLAGLRPNTKGDGTDNSRRDTPRIAVIVPAHDMEAYIERCVNSLRWVDYPQEQLQIFVVADHCSDKTADLARAAGATVLTREVEPRGKTYTLAWAFEELASCGVDADLYVIVDATAYVASAFLNSLGRHWSKGEDIVIAHAIVDAENQKWFARCMGLTLAHRNLQDLARERLALSALVSGRGMAYSHAYIGKFGWRLALPTSATSGTHPTEDFRHGVRLAEHGYRVAFADEALVFTPLRESFSAATRQGLRWEKGRIANVRAHATKLLRVGLSERNLRKVIAALDAIQPPVAVLIGTAALVAFLALVFLDSTFGRLLASTPLALGFIYSLLVLKQGQKEGIKIRTVIWAPVYLAWRCMAFLLAIAGLDRLVREGRHDR